MTVTCSVFSPQIDTEGFEPHVLEALRPVDLVAYVRFASVYQEVQSPADFVDILRPWLREAESS